MYVGIKTFEFSDVFVGGSCKVRADLELQKARHLLPRPREIGDDPRALGIVSYITPLVILLVIGAFFNLSLYNIIQ